MESSVKHILDLIKNDFINNDGLLSKTYPPSSEHLLNDFNDYIPFLSFFKCDHFVDNQISIAKTKTIAGLVPIDTRIISWRQDEWLEALGEIFKKSKDAELFNLIENGLKYIQNKLVTNGFIKAFYNLKSKVSPHVFDPRTGALLEALLDLGDDFPLASDLAYTCLDSIVDWSRRNKQFLLPNFIFINSPVRSSLAKINFIMMPKRYTYPYVRGWRAPLADFMVSFPFASEVKLAKQNCNLIHAFLRAYEFSKNKKYFDFVNNWMKEFKEFMYDCGRCFSSKKKDLIKLSHNHPVVDICFELHRLTRKIKHLEMAVEIVDFWLSIRLSNGLFPVFEGSYLTHLDHQTDMIVILAKLSKFVNREEYLGTANNVLNAVLAHHKTEKGFVTYLDSRNRNGYKRGVIHPKYNALFLKAFIAVENADKIMDKKFRMLLRDR